MPGTRYQRTAEEWWLRVRELDLRRQRRSRPWTKLAQEIGVDPKKLTRWVREHMMPPADTAARIATTVGMSPEEHLNLLLEPVDSTGDPVTPG